MTPATSTLSGRANLVLACLHQHRLLTTRQLHTMTNSGPRLRGTQQLLADLAGRGLISSVAVGGGRRGRELVFHLTPLGAGVVHVAPTPAEPRRKPVTPEMAAGPLQRHTLAVNQTGIAFMQAARQRGDECGPLAWRHEVAHRISPNRTDVVIADAVLRHQPVATAPGKGVAMDYRFIELDRATTAVDQLASKLGRYAELATYTPAGAARPGWARDYLALPELLVVFSGASPARLTLRAAHVVSLCRQRRGLGLDPAILVSLCELTDLTARGPYAPIFTRLHQPQIRCDWLGAEAGS
ncbi:replication-relaxation family protein [Paraconexibacter antarcticus]|uniref:Replication-relaxation family protein n=1 Tax=Paraconexibacter antarcticus TaxID=2949664 RepID=A0ABY5DTP7_9ACTN|nr:replication-relaxation family protein [Paraconexibacter antarcticus]UTI63924.1 replication-relaxation family protein [Paraconexibacter antarcticus]